MHGIAKKRRKENKKKRNRRKREEEWHNVIVFACNQFKQIGQKEKIKEKGSESLAQLKRKGTKGKRSDSQGGGNLHTMKKKVLSELFKLFFRYSLFMLLGDVSIHMNIFIFKVDFHSLCLPG